MGVSRIANEGFTGVGSLLHQQEMKRAPYAYDAWATGRILERPYALDSPEVLLDLGVDRTPKYSPDLGVLTRLGVRVYWGVNCTSRYSPDLGVFTRLGVRVYWGVDRTSRRLPDLSVHTRLGAEAV